MSAPQTCIFRSIFLSLFCFKKKMQKSFSPRNRSQTFHIWWNSITGKQKYPRLNQQIQAQFCGNMLWILQLWWEPRVEERSAAWYKLPCCPPATPDTPAPPIHQSTIHTTTSPPATSTSCATNAQTPLPIHHYQLRHQLPLDISYPTRPEHHKKMSTSYAEFFPNQRISIIFHQW